MPGQMQGGRGTGSQLPICDYAELLTPHAVKLLLKIAKGKSAIGIGNLFNAQSSQAL